MIFRNYGALRVPAAGSMPMKVTAGAVDRAAMMLPPIPMESMLTIGVAAKQLTSAEPATPGQVESAPKVLAMPRAAIARAGIGPAFPNVIDALTSATRDAPNVTGSKPSATALMAGGSAAAAGATSSVAAGSGPSAPSAAVPVSIPASTEPDSPQPVESTKTALDIIPPSAVAKSTSADNSKTKLFVGLGVAAAVYFLFIRK